MPLQNKMPIFGCLNSYGNEENYFFNFYFQDLLKYWNIHSHENFLTQIIKLYPNDPQKIRQSIVCNKIICQPYFFMHSHRPGNSNSGIFFFFCKTLVVGWMNWGKGGQLWSRFDVGFEKDFGYASGLHLNGTQRHSIM